MPRVKCLVMGGPRSLFIMLTIAYRNFFSPIVRMVFPEFGCKYPITCSEFALNEFRTSSNMFRSTARVCSRLLSCGPWFQFANRK